MNAPARPRVLLLCGGRSDEHEVSLASAASVLEASRERLEVVPLVVERSGRVLPPAASQRALERARGEAPTIAARSADAATAASGAPPGPGTPDGGGAGAPADLVAAAARFGAAGDLSGDSSGAPSGAPSGALSGERADGRGFDAVFPLFHGPYGEDGSVQGLLKLAGVPFVGSGVLGSAVGMDKLMMKAVFAAHGLPQVRYAGVDRQAWRSRRDHALAVLEPLPWPRFVKPANLGSSIGIARADTPDELADAVEAALRHDRRAIVEEGVTGCRELEVGVLGNDAPEASPVGEIRFDARSGGFYDYETKYADGRAELCIPATLPAAVAERCRALALRAFAAVDAAGLARVDFFYREADDALWLNEINTMPGFTRTSMYPKLWEAAGVPYGELVERLVRLALEPR